MTGRNRNVQRVFDGVVQPQVGDVDARCQAVVGDAGPDGHGLASIHRRRADSQGVDLEDGLRRLCATRDRKGRTPIIEVDPAIAVVDVGLTQQFTATIVRSDVNAALNEDVTAQATWASLNTAVAIISDQIPTKGLATVVGPGVAPDHRNLLRRIDRPDSNGQRHLGYGAPGIHCRHPGKPHDSPW